jgi:glycosyltransferase involved in cell wall biosynthesis
MKVCVVANSRDARDRSARQWYEREVDTFAALGAQTWLAAGPAALRLPDLYVSWWAARSAPVVVWSRLTGRKCLVVAGGADSIPDCPGLPGHPFFYRAKPWWVKALTRLALRGADAVAAVSEATRPAVKQLGARRIFVVPNAVDTDLFCPAAGKPDGRIVTVCNMEPAACALKGLPVVLEAFRQVRERFPGVRLVVAGSHGAGWPRMRALAERLGLRAAVEFPGAIPNRDMARLLQNASAFVTATRYETFGVAIAEAMACGLPVVASDLPAVREVVGSAALLVDPSRPENFAAALVPVLADSEYAKALGQSARRRICARYSREARVTAMRSVLAGLEGND